MIVSLIIVGLTLVDHFLGFQITLADGISVREHIFAITVINSFSRLISWLIKWFVTVDKVIVY